jgi:hypothetical protein
MTLQNIYKRVPFLLIITLLSLASCESNNELESDLSSKLNSEEARVVLLSDDLSDDIDNLVEDDAKENGLTTRSAKNNSNLPSCAERTSIDTSDGKIVTLDFGDGCVGRRGKEFAGKIIIEYIRTDDDYSKSVTFEDFTIDDNTVEGSKSISKTKANTNGNPQKSHSVDIMVTFTSGEIVSKKGTKVKEKIEGSDTEDRGDDIYSISGNWESVNKEGYVKTAEITTNLTRTYACRYIVSGVVEIVKDGEISTLDFGNGSCDNVATLTDVNGNVEEIILRRR